MQICHKAYTSVTTRLQATHFKRTWSQEGPVHAITGKVHILFSNIKTYKLPNVHVYGRYAALNTYFANILAIFGYN